MAVYTQTQAGNWNTNATWGGGGHPVAGDTANLNSTYNCTIDAASACATLNMTGYSGTMSFSTFNLTISNGATLQGNFSNSSTGQIIMTGGGVTLAATPTGSTFPLLIFTTAGQTLTSGGFTWPGNLTLGFAATYTLAGNWTTNGLTVMNVNLTLSGAYTYTAAGGFTMTGTVTNNLTSFNITGGTWTGDASHTLTGTGAVNIGSCALSGSCPTASTNITLLAGSTITGTGTLTVNTGTGTFTTNGVTLPNLFFSTTSTFSYTWTKVGNILVAGNFTIQVNNGNNAISFDNGAYDIVCNNLIIIEANPVTNNSIAFTRSQNVTVLGGIYIGGSSTYIGYNPFTIKSTTGSTAFNLNYLGKMMNEYIYQTQFTDCKADGSGITGWVTSTPYIVGNCVAQGGLFYRCIVAHTSGTFATDLANGDWVQMILQPIYGQYGSTPATLLRTAGIASLQANSFMGM